MRAKSLALVFAIIASGFALMEPKADSPSVFRDAVKDFDTEIPVFENDNGIPTVPKPMVVEDDDKSEYDGPRHGPTPQEERDILNRARSILSRVEKIHYPEKGTYRPYADYERTGYVITSADFSHKSRKAKLEVAKNLPADAFLVVFADLPAKKGSNTGFAKSFKDKIVKSYSSVLTPDRIIVISLPDSNLGFWARDGVPVPVFDQAGSLTLIDAVYYKQFEPDREISRLFNAGYKKHPYTFEGGNFQANHTGSCMIVENKGTTLIPDDVLHRMYGCKKVIRLPHMDGIGHIDEHARFINETTVVTDLPLYQTILQEKGLSVYLLPRPAGEYQTYVNSLILNDRVVVPVFGQRTDAQALAVYNQLGLKAAGADSAWLSTHGQGSVHCITVTYPKVPLSTLTKTLGASAF